MPQLAVNRPLNKSDLHDDVRPNPVSANARQAGSLGEGRSGDLDPIQTFPQLTQHLRIESGSNFPRKEQIVTLEMTNEQCAQANARTLWIGEATDHEIAR